MIQFDKHIFEMGWFYHQRAESYGENLVKDPTFNVG